MSESQLTTAEAIEKFQNDFTAKRATSTANRYERELRQFAEWLEAEHPEASLVEPETLEGGDGIGDDNLIERWLLTFTPDPNDDEDDGYAPNSIQNKRAALNSFYRELWGEDGPNPAESVHPGSWSHVKQGTKKSQAAREGVVFIEMDEIKKMAENAPAPRFRNGLIIRLLAQTGIRRGELCNLRVKDVDNDKRSIKVRGEKTSTNRTVYYQDNLANDMHTWLTVRRDTYVGSGDSDWLFPTNNSPQIGGWRVGEIVRDAAKAADVQETLYTDKNGNPKYKVTAHTLRHSYAVECVRSGMDIVRLATLMGHYKQNGEPAVSTTKKYLKFKESDRAEAAREHGPRV